jgi:hypothetical protein
MEEFPKEYEDIFTSEKTLKKCKIENVSTGDESISTDKYIRMFREEISSYQKIAYSFLVKAYWLMRRFHYCGKIRRVNVLNGNTIDGAFGVFMRYYVGHDSKLITRNDVFSRISSYFDEFYPDFDINNPFETEYSFPYQNLTMEHLFLVHAMPERLDLLARAEKKKMSYSEFMDYVLNYISVYNERYGETYHFKYTYRCPIYIKYLKKNGKQ